MREVKFRAWDTKKRQWLNFGYMLDDQQVKPRRVDDGSPDTILNLVTFQEGGFALQQYTGVKDKNGVEIYEGDIIDVVTERVSSSHSTWYQRTNAHHGDVTLKMYVKWDIERGQSGLSGFATRRSVTIKRLLSVARGWRSKSTFRSI